MGRFTNGWATLWGFFKQTLTPSAPPATYNKLYFKSGDGLYSKNSAGTERTYLASGDAISGSDITVATTSSVGVVELATPTESITGTSTTLVNTPSGAAAQIAVHTNPKAFAQGVYLTASATVGGIRVADNANLNFGTQDFALRVRGAYPANTLCLAIYKMQDSSNFWNLSVTADNKINIAARVAASYVLNYTTTATVPYTANGIDITATVRRETAGADGLISVYVNGVLLESTAITAAVPVSITNTGVLYISGGATTRYASTNYCITAYNRALTAAEVLDLYRNGVASKHFDQTGVSPASQTPQTSGSLVAGKEYVIDTYVSDDDFTNVATVVSGTINTNGCIFVASGTTPTKWTNSSSLRRTGATLYLPPECLQPAPGQWLDASGNRLHAMQPASGSSLVRFKRDFEFLSRNTWTAGSSAAQYIGGINQNVVTAKHRISEIIPIPVVTTNLASVTIGDGSDADYYVAAVDPNSVDAFALLKYKNDGTNFKLTITPTSGATMTIDTITRGFLIE